MISVVVPIYNVSSFLKEGLDSLYLQQDVGIEVILVNDGSTDNSFSICKDYNKRYPDITIIIDKENGGLSDARNAGIDVATGEWIYFFDSDDVLVPRALKRLHDFATSYSCSMVSGGFFYDYGSYLLYDDRWLKDESSFVLSHKEAMAELVKQHYLKNFAWGKLYKTEIVKNHPFRKGVYFEDSYWQHLIINECEKVGVVPEPLYYYRQREGSISGGFSERNLDLLKGNEERLRFIEENYPVLLNGMASSFWRMCNSFKRFAESTGKEELVSLYSSYYSEIEARYGDLFDISLSGDINYAFRKNKALSSAYHFSRRVWDHLFGKRLKRVEYTR